MSAILPPNDERIRKFLRQAGVDENSPVDPVSRDALLELLQETRFSERTVVKAASPVSQESGSPSNEYSTTLPENPSEIRNVHSVENLEQTPSQSQPTMTSEERMFHMMQQQTQMIHDLHKRMDYLTELVLQNNNNQQHQPTIRQPTQLSREDLNRQIDELFEQVRLYEQNAEQSSTWKVSSTVTSAPPTAGQPRSFASQQGHHLYQIAQIFFALRRRLAPNFDAGLIVKVVFILSILFTRLSRRQQSMEMDDEEWIWHFYRLHILVLFVVGGFLFQTGMLKVIYIFYVQEKYFKRILWKGEEVEDIEQEVNEALERYSQRIRPRNARGNQPPLPRQPPRPRDEDFDAGHDNIEENHDVGHQDQQHAGWRDTFLGGVIEPAPQNEQDRGVQFLRDIGLFIGSFFLSILPMWRPEATVGPRTDRVDDAPGADDGNGLPEVTAPADVLQAAEDEDEDGNEEAKAE